VPAHAEVYTPPLRRFDGARTLLDALGCQDASDDPLSVELAPHRSAVADAAELATDSTSNVPAEALDTLRTFRWATSR
jgi:hypothetical protein